MRILTRLVAGACAAATMAALAVAPTAMADPINNSGKSITPHVFDVVGTGSDTIESLLDQFMVSYNKAHTTDTSSHPHLYSWDATNPKTGQPGDMITPKAKCAKTARPDGSSAGITALTSNTKASDHKHFCFDFARSSRGRASGDPSKGTGGIEFVPIGKDAVAYATQGTTNAPHNLTTAQLTEIYTCSVPAVGSNPPNNWADLGGKAGPIHAFLPQIGSGTRAFFLSAIGADGTASCLNSSVQENEGTNKLLKDPNAIVPYSIGKWIAERFHSAKCLTSSCTPVSGKVCKPAKTQNQFGCDVHGTMVLRSIDGTPPTVGSGASTKIDADFSPAFIRKVYVVVRWASTHDGIPKYLEPFFGAKGWVCSSKAAKTALANYGFLTTPLCGLGF